MNDHCEVIAAFVDNEPVRADELAAALAGSLGREYLIDLLVLRGLVGDAQVARSHVAGSAASYVAGGLRRTGDSRRPEPVEGQPAGHAKRRGLWLTAAAALVAISVGTGFFAGRVTDGAVSTDSGEAGDIAEPAGSSTQPAPAPTHVIRMEKGVDWNERSGGN